ncbi:hypothetical protein F0562_002400 [Nyssa sinensis]|uniref:Uncharacterized protein n=1 Tax=Nyssa sinensis TaxID=561372 RepID=A0A5J5C6V4_9ASTE|nr:hypothetical protein F0562_002400 [Nyssa sinensis]
MVNVSNAMSLTVVQDLLGTMKKTLKLTMNFRSGHKGAQDRQQANNHSENGAYIFRQQWHTHAPAFSSIAGSVADKDFEGDQEEAYNNAEWKERVEKWKTRQEKKGLVSKDD